MTYCPEGCGVAMVEEELDTVVSGCPNDPYAKTELIWWSRCPLCGYQVETESMLPAFVRKDGRPAPSQNDPQFDPFHDETLEGDVS